MSYNPHPPQSINQRLAKILSRLAIERYQELLAQGRQSQPLLSASNPQTEGEMRRLVRILADENVLVLMGSVPQPYNANQTAYIQTWVNLYAALYNLFANALFSSLNRDGPRAIYADGSAPAVIVMRGGAAPVIEVLAGFVVPFVARGQGRGGIPEADYRVLVDVLCDELDCSDLSMNTYQALRRSAMTYLTQLVEGVVRQLPLTQFDRKLFNDPPPDVPRGGQPGGAPPTTPPDRRHTTSSMPPLSPPPGAEQYPMDYLKSDNGVVPNTTQMFRDTVPVNGRATGTLPPAPPPETPKPAPREEDDDRDSRESGRDRRRRNTSLPVDWPPEE
jgi:hypothetical protein